VNANSAFAAAAFPFHLGSQISNVDSKFRRASSVSRFSAHDPGHYVAGLEHANLEHVAAASYSLGSAIQGVTERLP
jgi:hypothetical protein